MRVYIRNSYFSPKPITLDRLDDLVNEIMATPIRGVPGIQNVNVFKSVENRADSNTGAMIKDSVYAIKTVR